MNFIVHLFIIVLPFKLDSSHLWRWGFETMIFMELGNFVSLMFNRGDRCIWYMGTIVFNTDSKRRWQIYSGCHCLSRGGDQIKFLCTDLCAGFETLNLWYRKQPRYATIVTANKFIVINYLFLCWFRYVGNLDHVVSEDLLCALFSHIDSVRSCKIIREVSLFCNTIVIFT